MSFISHNISPDDDAGVRVESSAIINLRVISTKLNLYCVVVSAVQTPGFSPPAPAPAPAKKTPAPGKKLRLRQKTCEN